MPSKRLSISDANPDGETKRLIEEIKCALRAQTGVEQKDSAIVRAALRSYLLTLRKAGGWKTT